jgi:hypothetical protein
MSFPSSISAASDLPCALHAAGARLGALASAGRALVLLCFASLGASPAAAAADPAVTDLLLLLAERGIITEEERKKLEARAAPAAGPAGPAGPAGAPAAVSLAPTAPRWYESLRMRGYLQLRHSDVLSHEGAELEVPADRSVRESEMFVIRRGRVVLSGDATKHLAVYAQADFNASTGASDFGLQMRDLYGDLSLDDDREYRFRFGQFKVPFGWVNLQSSQNRGPLERPDAINSAAEGERDVGAAFMWAPAHIRQRFGDLVSRGLKGSGDYGVFALGAFSGQGPNRSDANGEPHWMVRLSYPFEMPGGQLFEIGAQAYRGRFVVSRQAISVGGVSQLPIQAEDGVLDERVGVSFVWYPQPFGIEAEWNFGRSPELSEDLRRIESKRLQGGYVQLGFRQQSALGTWFPFARWNYYRGARKFATNAPRSRVHEIDVGLEWAPWPELELALMYTHSFERTNTRTFPYEDTRDATRLGAQAQWNF